MHSSRSSFLRAISSSCRTPELAVLDVKVKSTASEEENHGTCSPREALATPALVFAIDRSALMPGTRISLRNSRTKSPCAVAASLITEPRDAEYMTWLL